MVFFLGLGISAILVGSFFLWLALRGRNPQNLVEISGELTNRKHFKNAKIRFYTVKNLVEYTYIYVVNGKQYHLNGSQQTHPRNLRKRKTIVYLRGFPRVAYFDHFSGIAEWALAISLILLGFLCVGVSFFVV